MAKDIKAIQCPHCGSIYKLEVKPDFYRCQNCGTEYYLDSDDIHVYHHHQPAAPLQSSSPPGSNTTPVYILIGSIAVIVVVYIVAMLFFTKSGNKNYINASAVYKMPRSNFASYVYTNSETGDPIYLRLGTDYIDKGNNKQDIEIHAQYNNAANGKLITDKTMFDDEPQKRTPSHFSFKTYKGNLIYAICNDISLFQIDTKTNRLTDITQNIFKNFPQLSSGIAKLEFAYEKDVINVMNNEGNIYYYFPVTRQLVNNEQQVRDLWKQQASKHYFGFGYIGDDFDQNKYDQLIEVKYFPEAGQPLQRDLTPGRKYFGPHILYQDDSNLLITTNTTPAGATPISLQSIDVNTGKVKWAFPPGKYDFYSVCKCRQGFAVEYRTGEESDYVHGVFVISPAGKLVYNYQLSRTE